MGRGARTPEAVMLTLGTGVGGGILADGRLLRGMRGVAGHLGHLTVDPDGPHLHLRQPRLSGDDLLGARRSKGRRLRRPAGVPSCLTDEFRDPRAITCEAVFAAAREGDEIARAICDRAIKYLAGAIARIFGAFDPEVVILGGQIAEAGPALFEPLQEQVTARTRRLVGRDVPLIRAEIVESGVVGAAALVKLLR